MNYRPEIKAFFRICSAALALLFFAGNAAESAAPDPVRFGLEVELTEPYFANLVSYFDFKQLQTTSMNTDAISASNYFKGRHGFDISEHYLRDNPAALDSLPTALRQELTKGLNLQSRVLMKNPVLLNAEGKPAEKKSGLFLNSAPTLEQRSGLILPGETKAPLAAVPTLALPEFQALDPKLMQSSGGIEIANSAAWEELQRRWMKIPEETRREVLKWELLGPTQKAALGMILAEDLKLKADLAPEDKALFNGLSWHKDQYAMEFAYKNDHVVHGSKQYLADLRTLAKKAGAERELFDPEYSRLIRNKMGKASALGVSLHIHLSVKGKKLDPLIGLINDEYFLRRLQQGVVSDLAKEVNGTYQPNTLGKGLVKNFEDGHAEVRVQPEDLEKEVARLENLFAEPDLDKAVSAVKKEIAGQLNAEVASRVIRNTEDGGKGHRALINILRKVFPVPAPVKLPGDREAKAKLFQEVRALYKSNPEAALLKMREVLEYYPAGHSALNWITGKLIQNPETASLFLVQGWPLLESAIKSSSDAQLAQLEATLGEMLMGKNPELKSLAVMALSKIAVANSVPSEATRKAIQELIQNEDWLFHNEFGRALFRHYKMMTQNELPEFLPKILKSPDIYFRVEALQAIVRQPPPYQASPELMESLREIAHKNISEHEFDSLPEVFLRYLPNDQEAALSLWANQHPVPPGKPPLSNGEILASLENRLSSILHSGQGRDWQAVTSMAKLLKVDTRKLLPEMEAALARGKNPQLLGFILSLSNPDDVTYKLAVDSLRTDLLAWRNRLKGPGLPRSEMIILEQRATAAVELVKKFGIRDFGIIKELRRLATDYSLNIITLAARETLKELPSGQARQLASPDCQLQFKRIGALAK